MRSFPQSPISSNPPRRVGDVSGSDTGSVASTDDEAVDGSTASGVEEDNELPVVEPVAPVLHTIHQGEGGEQGMPLLFALGQPTSSVSSQRRCPENTVMAFLDDIYLVSKPQGSVRLWNKNFGDTPRSGTSPA